MLKHWKLNPDIYIKRLAFIKMKIIKIMDFWWIFVMPITFRALDYLA